LFRPLPNSHGIALMKIVIFEFLSFSKSIYSKHQHFPGESWTTKVYLNLPLTESVARFVAFFYFDFESVFENILF
jgi:hypothetical protein